MKFKGSQKEFYSNLTSNDFKNRGLLVLVVNKNGYDVGHGSLTGDLAGIQLKKKLRAKNIFNSVYRRVNSADVTKSRPAKDL